ncbi:Rab-like protein 3 [Mortierella sp. AM989]|nr:Rab-like protein 3 [Mortierella sp. AM989]
MQHYHGSGYSHDATFKVLVLGDSGVGKSSLVHMLCHSEPLRPAMPTVGCNIDVRLHSSTIPTAAAASTSRPANPSLLARTSHSPDPISNAGAETFIEFYDISGSPAVRNPKSRTMFYSGATYQGLILVHDLCNKRSYENLWRWIGDYIEVAQSASMTGGETMGYGGGQYGQFSIPLLVVGTKNDIPASYDQQNGAPRLPEFDLIEKYGGEAISVCAVSPADFMPNSSASIAFNMFFSRVIDPSSSNSSTSSDSRQRNMFNNGGVYPSGAAPLFSRSPPTPTPEQERSQYPEHLPSDSSSGSSSIPILDFATFTGGSTADRIEDRHVTTRSGSPISQDHIPVRSVTPTGISSSTTSTKSALRAQYERNRSVLNQYSNMGVPVYTSRSTTPTKKS